MTDLNFLRSQERGVKSVSTSYRKQFALFRLYKCYVIDSIYIVRNYSFKTLLELRGAKILLLMILYYLIRDSILYLIIPFFIAKEIIKYMGWPSKSEQGFWRGTEVGNREWDLCRTGQIQLSSLQKDINEISASLENNVPANALYFAGKTEIEQPTRAHWKDMTWHPDVQASGLSK